MKNIRYFIYIFISLFVLSSCAYLTKDTHKRITEKSTTTDNKMYACDFIDVYDFKIIDYESFINNREEKIIETLDGNFFKKTYYKSFIIKIVFDVNKNNYYNYLGESYNINFDFSGMILNVEEANTSSYNVTESTIQLRYLVSDDIGTKTDCVYLYAMFIEDAEIKISLNSTEIYYKEFIIQNVDFLYKINGNNTIEIVEYQGDDESLVIEECVGNYTINEIDAMAFMSIKNLKYLTLPSSIKTIGSYAFYNCTSLLEVTINEEVDTIGEDIFYGCSSLEKISIPFIGDMRHSKTDTYQYPIGYLFSETSFENSYKIDQTYYGPSASSVTTHSYYIPLSLKTIEITNSSYIPYGAFSGCEEIESITISSYISSIESYTFYECTSLSSLTIPYGITSIDSNAFYGCSALKDVYYNGTKENFDEIVVGFNNANLTYATIHYEK